MNILTADQKVRLTVRYEDRYGNPASIDGAPRWESSNDGIVTIIPAADGMSADVVTAGPVGTVQVRAIADAMLGTGEKMIIGIADLEVVGGEAHIVTLTAGAAEPKEDTVRQSPADEGQDDPDDDAEGDPDQEEPPVPTDPGQRPAPEEETTAS